VLEFDQAGNLVGSWGGPGAGYEWPVSNHGITVDHKGNVWIGGNDNTDTQLLKFTKGGKFLLQIGKHGVHNGSNDTANLWRAAKIFPEPDANEIYVADGYGNRRVIVFDADTGKYKRHWGAYGSKPTTSRSPTTIRRHRPRSTSTPCTAPTSRRTASCTSATASTIACRCSARTARSSKKRSSRRTRCAQESCGDMTLSRDAQQTYIYMPTACTSTSTSCCAARSKCSPPSATADGRPGQFFGVHNLDNRFEGQSLRDRDLYRRARATLHL
jgi:hypothetical protein